MSTKRINQLVDLSSYWIKKSMDLLQARKGKGFNTVMDVMAGEYQEFCLETGDLERDYFNFCHEKHERH